MGELSYLPAEEVRPDTQRPSTMFPDGFSLTPLALRAHPDADLALIGFYTRLWEIAEHRTRRIDGYSLRDLAESVSTPRTTTARYLDRLVAMGFVYKEDRGRGRGNMASYILLPKLIEHPITPEQKSPTTTHLTAEKSHTGAPNPAKSPTGGTHLGSESPTGGTHQTATPLLIDRDKIEEQVRTSKMESCTRCTEMHRQFYNKDKFANARKRFNRSIAVSAYVHVVYLLAHGDKPVETPWGLLYAVAKCYQMPDRGECGLEDCAHGTEATSRHRARRLDDHSTQASLLLRTQHKPAPAVAEKMHVLVERSVPVVPTDDLEDRRRKMIARLREMETTAS